MKRGYFKFLSVSVGESGMEGDWHPQLGDWQGHLIRRLQSCGWNPGFSYLKMLQIRVLKKKGLLLLLLSCFSHVRLCATPLTEAHQAPPSLGVSRQEHWSELPFPSPLHEREKWKWSRSVVSDSSRPHGLQPTRLLRPWDFPGKSTGVGCHWLLWMWWDQIT